MMDRKVRQWLSLLMPEQEPAIYPVDLRLRPEGENGPLVMTFKMAERYFFSVQRTGNGLPGFGEGRFLVKVRNGSGKC